MLARDQASVGLARSWLGDFLAGHGISGQGLEDALLVVSELVTNGLRHGLGEVAVRARLGTDVLHLAVTDSASELPVLLLPDPTRIGGVGIRVVDAISRQWGVASFPGGKTVWADLPMTPGP
jgi:anti-sigma regulatory factor (Ser/Thr protein kinase)